MSPARILRGRAPIVLVSGGKGGVGKTTIAANLALELSRRGHRTLLVDLDLALGDVHVLLHLTPPRTIEDALSGAASFGECIVRGPSGLDVLAAGSGTLEMAHLDEKKRALLASGLRDLARRYDVVVADGASGIGTDALAFCSLADHVLVVTTPDPTALTDAYGLIKALHAFGEAESREVPTPELVINLASGLEEAESTAAKLRIVCERFLARSPRSAGWLPASSAVELACRRQRPFALERARSLSAACLERLAARVERLCVAPETFSASSRVR